MGTTGEVISTLIRCGFDDDRMDLMDLAIRCGRWLLEMQRPDGSLPGVPREDAAQSRNVFDVSRMISGLMSAFRLTKDDEFLNRMATAARWLLMVQHENGTWTRYSDDGMCSCSFDVRIASSMLAFSHETGNEQIYDAAVRCLDQVAGRTGDGWIEQWESSAEAWVSSNSIAGILRGFLESVPLLDDADRLQAATEEVATALFRRAEIDGRIAGRYSRSPKGQIRGDLKSVCLAGTSQLAWCWLRLYSVNNDVRLLNLALKAIDTVTLRQRVRSWDPYTVGAIPGFRTFGKRERILSFSNRATKSYLDALIELGDVSCAKEDVR